MDTMLAAVYRGVNDVRVEQVPIPTASPGELTLRIEACGVCGTDLKKIQLGLAEAPRVFGHEMAGTVYAVGTGVTQWQVGDRAAAFHHVPCMHCHYCTFGDYAQCATYLKTGTVAAFEPAGGGFAQYVRVLPHVVAHGIVRIPDDVSFEQAAFLEPVNTVLKGIVRAHAQAGETALVFGQGQIGLLFTQILHHYSVRVLGVDPLSWRRDAALSMGAEAARSPFEPGFSEWVSGLTQGRGADLAVVAVANSGAAVTAMDCIRPGGRTLLFAQTRMGDVTPVDLGAVCMREKSLIGSYSADITLQDSVNELVFGRKIDVARLITHRFPLEQIAEAIATASNPKDGSLKVMVTP